MNKQGTGKRWAIWVVLSSEPAFLFSFNDLTWINSFGSSSWLSAQNNLSWVWSRAAAMVSKAVTLWNFSTSHAVTQQRLATTESWQKPRPVFHTKTRPLQSSPASRPGKPPVISRSSSLVLLYDTLVTQYCENENSRNQDTPRDVSFPVFIFHTLVAVKLLMFNLVTTFRHYFIFI